MKNQSLEKIFTFRKSTIKQSRYDLHYLDVKNVIFEMQIKID